MIHVWTMPCRLACIDRDTNNVSLIEILEQVRVQQRESSDREPGVNQFEIVTLWARDDPNVPETNRGRVSLVSPGGETLFSAEYDVDLQEFQRSRQRGRIIGLPIGGAGRHVFRVEVYREDDWHTVGEVPLWVDVDEQVLAADAPPQTEN